MVMAIDPAVVEPSSCIVSADGTWQCKVGPVTASFQSYTITVASEGNSISIHEVLFGDVWVSDCDYYFHHIKSLLRYRVKIQYFVIWIMTICAYFFRMEFQTYKICHLVHFLCDYCLIRRTRCRSVPDKATWSFR